MEITLEAIISVIGLLAGGTGIGGFFVWKYTKRKAQAEAKQAEAEAVRAEAEAMIEKQNYYQQMADDLAKDRDYYKADRDELREKVDKLTKMFYELKTEGEKERAQLRVSISTLQSQLNGVIGMTCSVQDCKLRQVISFADEDPNRRRRKPKREQSEIDPINQEDM